MSRRDDDSRAPLAVALVFLGAGLMAAGLEASYTALVCAAIAVLVGLAQ